MQELWHHQKVGIDKAIKLGSFGLFFEQGTGKSRTVIEIVRIICSRHETLLNVLIVTPLITLQNWKNEFLKFSKIDQKYIYPLEGTGADKVKKIKTIPQGAIIIVNYDSLLNQDLMEALKLWTPQILIVDESQRIKNPTSKRTKAVHSFSKIALYRFVLSGTPILQSALDIWSQAFVVDQGKSFGDSFYKFKLRYFFDKNSGMSKQNYFPCWLPRKEMESLMKFKLDHISMSVKKEECLDLPPLVKQQVFVDMSPEQKKHYLQMKELFITYIEDKACVATLAMTKGLRLLQILSGHIPLDDNSILQLKDTPREKALQELLEDLARNNKIIIWAVFREDYKIIRRVCEAVDVQYKELHGEIDSKERFANVDEFNNNPQVKVLIAHPVSAGIGINLVSASIAIYYSRNFSLENDLQSEARNYRAGSEQHQKITRIDILVRNTIEEKVLESLHGKKEISANVLKNWAASLK